MAFTLRAVKVPPNSASMEEARGRVFDFFRQACCAIPSIMEIYNLDDVVTPSQLRYTISKQIRKNQGVSNPKVPPSPPADSICLLRMDSCRHERTRLPSSPIQSLPDSKNGPSPTVTSRPASSSPSSHQHTTNRGPRRAASSLGVLSSPLLCFLRDFLLSQPSVFFPSISLPALLPSRYSSRRERGPSMEEETEKQLFSQSDVSLHASRKDCWVVIHGKVYDVTKFLEDHPGGEDVLLHASGLEKRAQGVQ